MPTPIVVNLLLEGSCADPDEYAALLQALGVLGLEVSTKSRTTCTVRIGADRFEELFGVRPFATPARPPGKRDKGMPPGHTCDSEPHVPATLRRFVKSVGVEPPMTRF